MQRIDMRAMMQLKACKSRLTPQAYRTLRGQILAGDADGAIKGLRKILRRQNGGVKNGVR